MKRRRRRPSCTRPSCDTLHCRHAPCCCDVPRANACAVRGAERDSEPAGLRALGREMIESAGKDVVEISRETIKPAPTLQMGGFKLMSAVLSPTKGDACKDSNAICEAKYVASRGARDLSFTSVD